MQWKRIKRRAQHPHRESVLKELEVERITSFEEYAAACRIDAMAASREAVDATIETIGYVRSLNQGDEVIAKVIASFTEGVVIQTEAYNELMRRPVQSREERETILTDPFEPSLPPENDTPSLPRPAPRALPNQTNSQTSKESSTPSTNSPPKRRGRPPGSTKKKKFSEQPQDDGQPLEPLQDILDELGEDT